MIRQSRRTGSLARAAAAGPLQGQEPSADEFLARWAHDCVAAPIRGGIGAGAALTADELALVVRCAAPLFGPRPLGGLTFGELAALPALLEAHGFAPEASRAACRALGAAIRTALLAWGQEPRH